MFTGDVVTGGFSEAPKPLTTSGAWESRLKNMIHMLTHAYRQGRPTNFLEGYVPLSQTELDIVERHHPQCPTNLEKGSSKAYLQALGKSTPRMMNSGARRRTPCALPVCGPMWSYLASCQCWSTRLGLGTLTALAISGLARRTPGACASRVPVDTFSRTSCATLPVRRRWSAL